MTVGAATATFTFDALGRIKTRTTSSTETYAYLGTSETAWARATPSSTRASVIGLDGSRIATKDGTTTAYLVSDPHGHRQRHPLRRLRPDPGHALCGDRGAALSKTTQHIE